MADPISPELVEAAAEALANHYYPPNGWAIARDEAKAVYRSSARALLAAVAPLIDRAARANELRTYIDTTLKRDLARAVHHGADVEIDVIRRTIADLERRIGSLRGSKTP